MEKISSVRFYQPEYKTAKQNRLSASYSGLNINDLPQNSLNEAIGRSQVNFRGITDSLFKLTLQDKHLAEVVGKVFKLDEESVRFIEDYTKEFLEKHKVKSMSAFKSDDPVEFANELSCWAEKISTKLNFSDYESMDLDWFLTLHINSGDIKHFRNHSGETVEQAFRYSTDYTPIQNIFERHEVEQESAGDIFRVMSTYAKNHNLDSIFDLFKKEFGKSGDRTLIRLLEDFGVSSDKISDMLIDFHQLAGKSRKERLEGINIHQIQEMFDDGINALVIAGKIDDKFHTGVTKELLEMLESRKTDTLLHQDGKSLQEVAYRIADKFKLPIGADKDIIEIINAHTVPDSKEKIENLINTLKKGDK